MFCAEFSEQHITLAHGSMGLHALQAEPQFSNEQNMNTIEAVDTVNSNDTQALPSHLKCGMWASLVLATIFLVGKISRTTHRRNTIVQGKD